MRRSGKTTLAQSLGADRCLLVNCDLPATEDMLRDPVLFFRDCERPVVVFDEIHQLSDPSRVLKIAADEFPKLRVLATGSSALEARQAQWPDEPVRYWRDKAGREVDFVRPRARDAVDAYECKGGRTCRSRVRSWANHHRRACPPSSCCQATPTPFPAHLDRLRTSWHADCFTRYDPLHVGLWG